MACLLEKQIEKLAAGERATTRQQRHLAKCEKCRNLVEAASQDEQLVRQLRELRESRARIAHLIPADTTTMLGPSARPAPG